MRTLIFIILSILYFYKVNGQQPTQYTLLNYNMFAINPAYAGKEGSLSANLSIRQQWSNLQGMPQSQSLNAHLPINSINSGVGINLESDNAGLQQALQAALSYCYDVRLGKNAILALGVRGGVIQMNWNGGAIRTPDGNYQNTTEHKDNILGANSFNGQAPLLDLGALFQSKIIKIGFGVKNLTENSINYTINNGKIRLVTNYFFTFAAEFNISNNLILTPSVLFKSDVIENQTDINISAQLFEKFIIGTGYRGYSKNTNDAINIIGGIRLNEKIKLFYAYGLTMSPLKNASTGSHELLLQYNLNKPIGKGIPEKVIYNPRYY